MTISNQGERWLAEWRAMDLRSIALIVGWRSGAQIECARVPTSRDVASELRNICEETLEYLGVLQAREWSRDIGVEEDEYVVATSNQIGGDSPLIEALSTGYVEVLDAASLPERDLLFYCFAVGAPGQQLFFVRKYNPRRGLRHRLIAIFSDTLSRVTEPLFTFDNSVDLVLDISRGAAVINLKMFELLFRTSPEMLARTPAFVAQVAAALPLDPESAQALIDAAASNTSVQRRLQGIVERGHLVSVTVNALRREMRRHGLDPTDYLKNGVLTFDKAGARKVIMLLNEDLFRGGLSDEPFQADRKRPSA